MTYETLLVEVRDGVAAVTLNRPEARNALNRTLVRELGDALEALDADPEARVVVLRGAGDRAFCAGADLKGMFQEAPILEAREQYAGLARILAGIPRMRKPVIAQVHGYALAGGCGLAVACDLVVAAEDAVFGLPEVKLGLLPLMVLAPILRAAASPKRVLHMVLSGAELPAREALALGLVSQVMPRAELASAVDGLARTLAGYFLVDMHTLGNMQGRPQPKLVDAIDAEGLLRKMISKGANPNARLMRPMLGRYHGSGDATLGEGTTPFLRAAKAVDVPFMRALLEAGADPTLTKKDRTNAAMLVAAGQANSGYLGPGPRPKSALIPLLHLAQEQDGYVTNDAMAHIAELIGHTPAEVYGTATFYEMFKFEPVGKYLVNICGTMSCALHGCRRADAPRRGAPRDQGRQHDARRTVHARARRVPGGVHRGAVPAGQLPLPVPGHDGAARPPARRPRCRRARRRDPAPRHRRPGPPAHPDRPRRRPGPARGRVRPTAVDPSHEPGSDQS